MLNNISTSKDSFMIHWAIDDNGRVTWVGLRGDGTWADTGEHIAGKREHKPIGELITREAQEAPYEGSHTVEEFLRYVVKDSGYNPEDIVAIGMGDTAMLRKPRLHRVYLTERGLDEYTDPGELSVPYDALAQSVSRPEFIMPLSEANLGDLTAQISADPGCDRAAPQRIFVDWGGPDGAKRVLALYLRDTTRDTFKED